MAQNYYQDKITQIENMISQGKVQDAYFLVTKELNMPYIPRIYEEKFEKLNQELLWNIKLANKKQTINNLDSFLNMLFESEKKQKIALEAIKNYNLRPVKFILKKRIETWNNKSDALKISYLFEILVEQEIDIEIKINKQLLNPKRDSILGNIEARKAFSEIRHLVEKQPQLLELAEKQLWRYLLLKFPSHPVNGNLLAKQIINIVESMIKNDIELSPVEKELKEFID